MFNEDLITCVDSPKSSECSLSIIIPCRAEQWNVLAMTLQSIQEEASLIDSWECIVVFNNGPGECVEAEAKFMHSHFRLYGNFRHVNISTPGAWKARNAGTVTSVGKYLYFGDSHLILGRDIFTNLIKTFESIKQSGVNIGQLHSRLGWLSGVHSRDLMTKYKPRIKEKFWGNWSKDNVDEAHAICMSGISYIVEREVLLKLQGWNEHFKSYGGGETSIDLKTWMFGYEVWVEPSVHVWHLAQRRGYTWDNDILWYNFLLAAYTIGGHKWLMNQRENYSRFLHERHEGNVLVTYMRNLDKMCDEVIVVGKEERNFIGNKAKYTLDYLMAKYQWE